MVLPYELRSSMPCAISESMIVSGLDQLRLDVTLVYALLGFPSFLRFIIKQIYSFQILEAFLKLKFLKNLK